MAIPFHKHVTTFGALQDTILNDRYVYRWFFHLLIQPQVRLRIEKQADIEAVYRRLKALVAQQALWSVLCVAAVGAAFFVRHYACWIAAVVPFYFYGNTLFQKRQCVAHISLAIIREDFSEEMIGKKTLYQIAEFYSREYAIFSLVDAIYSLDQIYRWTAAGMLIAILFIYPAWYRWEGVALGLAAYFLVVNMTNVQYFYKRIK